MANENIGTPDQLKDPDYEIPMGPRTALGIQHVLAMFASNVTPSIIIAGAAGFAFGGEDMVFLVQMAMLFAGIATPISNSRRWSNWSASSSHAGHQFCLCSNHDWHC